MFTGLVEATGQLTRRDRVGPDARLEIKVGDIGEPLVLGESISIDGCCLTVQTILPDGSGFVCDASSETLARTTLGELTLPATINLERATPLGGRMGGHIVTGHIDGTGVLLEREPVGEMSKLTFGYPANLARFIAEKGSICVNGVSLTVNGVGADRFDVMIIPHTAKVTSLGILSPGGKVNLEVDVLARYILRAREVDSHAALTASTKSGT
ncbi:riboflavin synthase [Pendulispora albinea]|uniref:Riboflavin synthase n=1 Tax=Pendulispora albinea TaxID=2741071 RepID=A0ABZ2M2W5_9BACT